MDLDEITTELLERFSRTGKIFKGEMKIKYRGFFDENKNIQYPIIVYTPYKKD